MTRQTDIPAFFALWLIAVAALFGCNSDNDILPGRRPTIEFDNPDGIYTVRVGNDVRIDPVIGYGENAEYLWTMNDEVVSRSRALVMNCPREGSFYVMLTVTSPAGSASAEARIDVLEKTPPVIELAVPEGGIYVLRGEVCRIAPRFSHSDVDGFHVEWSVDGVVEAEGTEFEFSRNVTGDYTVGIMAENEDGKAEKSVSVHVVDQLPRSLSFPVSTAMQSADVRYTFPRRGVLLKPVAENISEEAAFAWSVNGEAVGNRSRELFFTPSSPGEYRVVVEAEGASAEVTVVCVDSDESSRFRPASAGSSSEVSKVWEYMPAPGQFIGDGSAAGGMPSSVTTAEDAAAWAKSRIEASQFVSLGAWGGYLVVGFDHSIPLSQSVPEIAVKGNAFKVSNEPGTVWVMQDVNGNGLPDDEWYQLKGSEWNNPLTLHDYAVTYYRPAGNCTDVEWTDNRGNRGLVAYLSSAHGQLSYYPAWASSATLTFRGIRLPANGTCDPVTGQWSTSPFAWGYADNLGDDTILSGSEAAGGEGQCVGLRISNAVYADGSPVSLQYVDFVMIQSALLQQLGVLGESSTEVCGVADNTLDRRR